MVDNAVSVVLVSVFLLLFEGILVFAAAFARLPWFYPLCGAVIVIVIVALQLASVVRLDKVQLDPSLRPSVPANVPLNLTAQETVRLRVVPVLWAGVRTMTLGVGTVKYPHNALLITDRSVVLIVVPMPGVGKLVGGTDYGLWHLLRHKEQIRQRLDVMLNHQDLETIIRSDAANLVLPLAQMKAIVFPRRWGRIQTGTFTFVMQSGEKYRYTVWDKDDLAALVRLLRSPLSGPTA